MKVVRIQTLDIHIQNCPFCDNSEKEGMGFAFESIPNEVHLRCANCQAEGPSGLNDYEAVEFWNDWKKDTSCKSVGHPCHCQTK